MPRLEVSTTDAKQANIQRRYYKRYGYCSCGFGVAWALLTICFLIINIIVFIEPQWIGDTMDSPGVGYVGLFQLCEFVQFGSERVCDGQFQHFETILTSAFRASTFFIGVSCLIIMLCILLFLLFLCVYATYVYIICGVLQVISTIFMFLGCVIFPAGWNHMYVRRICGSGVGKHHIGDCEMRWAYILAIIGIFDILILAILAFVLASRQRRRWANVDQTVKVQQEQDRPIDLPDSATKHRTSKKPPKGYVVDVTGTQQFEGSMPPPSYYGGTSRVGGRSGMYGSQPIYIVEQGGPMSEFSVGRRGTARPPRSVQGGVQVNGDGTRYRTGSERMRRDSY